MPQETPPDLPEPELVQEASHRLIRTVDALDDGAWAEPSGLPGWTRAHVVAHLTLNAEGLASALRGIVEGEPTPMYVSQEARDGDIEQLAADAPGELRNRLLGATTEFDDAVAAVPEDAWSTRIERVPGGRTFRAAAVPGMRLREIEIHHADLGAGYTSADWDRSFAVRVLDAMTRREPSAEPFLARATDVDRTWTFGEGGPTVSGSASALAWWLTGRGTGEGLTSEAGEIPEIEDW